MKVHRFGGVLAMVSLAGCLSAPAPAQQEEICTPGDQVECPCPGGFTGAQVCAPGGDRYLKCDCHDPAASCPEGETTTITKTVTVTVTETAPQIGCLCNCPAGPPPAGMVDTFCYANKNVGEKCCVWSGPYQLNFGTCDVTNHCTHE